MRWLITGATSRQANPEASKKDVSFSYLVAQALRKAGHEVEHRNPSLTEDLSGFDRVIVGIAPLHALGSNRAYGALSAIMRTWSTGQLILMIDDWDTGKIFSGIRTMVDTPARLTKPFFAYKLEHALASEEPWRSWLAEGVRLLRDSTWPPVIVPQHCWGETPKLVGAGTQLSEIIGVDPTSLIDYEYPVSDEPRRWAWTVEAPARHTWLESIQPFIRRGIERHGHGALPRFVNDRERMQRYATAYGVIAPPALNGNWWTPRPWLASQCGALVLTDWRTVRYLGQHWTLTPEQADSLTGHEAERVAREQKVVVTQAVPTPESVAKTLESIR